MSFQTGSIDADGMARTSDGKLYVTLGSGSTIPSPTFTGAATQADNGSFRWTTDTLMTRQGANRMMVSGDGTGAGVNVGWILGYGGASGYAGLWNSSLTPTLANGTLVSNNAETYLQGDTLYFRNSAGTAIGLTVVSTTTNGQQLGVKQLSELTTIAAAATTDTTIQMPAGAIVLAVSVRVTVLIPTAATFTVGDSGSAARFNTGAGVAVAAGTTDKGTKAGAYYNASALSVRITPNLTPADTTGRVRVTIHYLEVTPPTS